MLETGRSPFREYSRGVGLDYGIVRLDARDFRECAVNGLSLLAAGDHSAARDMIERALALYAGPFLPGKPGRIVRDTREVLGELHEMIARISWQTGSDADCFERLKEYRSPGPAGFLKGLGRMPCTGFCG